MRNLLLCIFLCPACCYLPSLSLRPVPLGLQTNLSPPPDSPFLFPSSLPVSNTHQSAWHLARRGLRCLRRGEIRGGVLLLSRALQHPTAFAERPQLLNCLLLHYRCAVAAARGEAARDGGFPLRTFLGGLGGELPQVVFVLGGPGSGKGTQCANLVSEFGWHHISAGDVLRAERRRPGSKEGELINNCIREGALVPARLTVSLLRRTMRAAVQRGCSRFLVDGFPRSCDNLDTWVEAVGSAVRVLAALSFDCPERVLEQRLLQRGITSGRVDDNSESIRKRFRTYHTQSTPVMAAFRQGGILREVDSNASKDVVWGRTKQALLELHQSELDDSAAAEAKIQEQLMEQLSLCHC